MMAFLWFKSDVSFWDRRHTLAFLCEELTIQVQGFCVRAVLEIWTQGLRTRPKPSFSVQCTEPQVWARYFDIR